MVQIISYKNKIKMLLEEENQSISNILVGIKEFQDEFNVNRDKKIDEFREKIEEIKKNCLSNENIVENVNNCEIEINKIENEEFISNFKTQSKQIQKQIDLLDSEREKLYEVEKKPFLEAKTYNDIKNVISTFLSKEMSLDAKFELLKSVFSE